MVDGKRSPSIGTENIAAVSSKFLNLTRQGKLPKHVWDSVAESTLPGEESGDEDDEEGEDEAGEEEEMVEEAVREAAGPTLPNPALSAARPVAAPRPRVEPPPCVQRNAAYYRPRRDGTAPNVEPGT